MSDYMREFAESFTQALARRVDAEIMAELARPSAADLDAVAEEDRIREATNGKAQSSKA